MMKLSLFLILFSCTTGPLVKVDPAVFYKHELCFKSEKIKFCGTGVLPYAKKYEIRVDSPQGDIDFLITRTCHRETTSRSPDNGIFKKDGRAYIEYSPSIENGRACPLYIYSFSKNGPHASGMIAFQHPTTKLPASLLCNGSTYQVEGVGICESREGLLQQVIFHEPVRVARAVNGPMSREEDCPDMILNGLSIEYEIPPRECLYQFMGQESKNILRLYTSGYERVLP